PNTDKGHASKANARLTSTVNNRARISRHPSQVRPFQTSQIREEIQADLKLVKLGCDSFVLFRRERTLDDVEEDMVFFSDVGSEQVGQPGCKFSELGSLFPAQGILEAFNKRAFPIVL